MMAKLLLAAAATSLTAAATPVPHHAGVKEMSAGYAAYMLCLQSAASRLDDNKSTPAALAPAVEASCQPQFEAVLNMFGSNADLSDADGIKAMQAKQRADQPKLVIVFIQGLRAEKSKNSN